MPQRPPVWGLWDVAKLAALFAVGSQLFHHIFPFNPLRPFAGRGDWMAEIFARIVLVGRLPSPEGRFPLPHFLVRREGRSYSARIVVVGPQKPALVLEWWRYVTDRAEVATDLAVVLTTQVFGHGELTAEETMIQELAGNERRDEFARAVLAHL